STSPAAASGRSMWNARIAAHTAASWHTQPASWNAPAVSAAVGSRMTPSPNRIRARSARTLPSPSTCEWRRAVNHAAAKSAMPAPMTTTKLVNAHDGSFAANSTQATSVIAGKRSNARCAKTEPISVGQTPLRPGSRRVSTPTRATSPTRPGSTTFANRPTQNAAKTSRNRGCGGGIAWWMVVFQQSERTTTESRLRPTAANTQTHVTTVNAPRTACQSGPRHQSSTAATPSNGSGRSSRQSRRSFTRSSLSSAQGSGRRRTSEPGLLVPRTAPTSGASRGDQLVRLLEPPRDVAPRVALARERARRAAHRNPTRLVLEQGDDRLDERGLVAGPHERRDLRRRDLRVADDVGGDDGRRRRERFDEDEPEALAAERRRDEQLRPRQLLRSHLVRDNAEHVDAVLVEAEAGAGAAANLRPGPQQDGQALARVVAADEHDPVLPVLGVGVRRDDDAVGYDVELAAEPAARRLGGEAGDGEARVDPRDQEAPPAQSDPHPGEIARRMPGRNHRAACVDERGGRDHGRQRLVHVHDVEPVVGQQRADAQDRARREDDVRQRAVRGYDHRAPDRDDARRKPPVTARARMERAREQPRWVVPHHQRDLVAAGTQRRRLVLGVLDDPAPVRPRERDDDSDPHA